MGEAREIMVEEALQGLLEARKVRSTVAQHFHPALIVEQRI